jgi:ATP-dependent Clp protease ATP-binding subunit ClpC
MFERFTERARRSMVLAQEEARLLGHPFIGTEHLLLGLIHEGEGVGAVALGRLGVSLEAVRAKVEETIRPAQIEPTGAGGSPPFTPRSKKVLELALREALQLGHNYIGTEHILLGIVREGEGVAARVLVDLGASLEVTRTTVLEVLGELPQAAPEPVARSGAAMAVPVGTGPSGSPPDCPHCRASLATAAAAHRLELDGATFVVVYCTECGRSLAFRPIGA